MNNNKTVLHVDDDTNDALLFQHACRKAAVSFHLMTVNDGDKAIAYLSGDGPYADRKTYPLPVLVLLDLKMPRRSGFEVLTWLRRHERLKWLPVVVFTSSKHEADIKQAYDLCANSYLMKPVGFDPLVTVVKVIDRYWLTLNELPRL